VISIDSSRCVGCETCALVCPHGVIEIEGHRASLAAESRCIECGACQLNCQEEAITVTKGTGCMVAIIKETWFARRSGKGATADGPPRQPSCGCG